MTNIAQFLMKIILVSTLFIASAHADDPFGEIATYDRNSFHRAVTDCDLLAAHHNDPERVSEGITQNDMDKPAAIAACLKALENDPDNPRLNYQLARAYGYSGLHEESDPYRLKALNAGYPQSLFVIGYISILSWDGRGADPCYGGELVRRSALAGRFAGLVGFPHYVQMGTFDQCETYPAINKTEMKSFLDQAKNSTDDYYHLILIERLEKGIEGLSLGGE